jgi:hypothetical protein
MNSSTMMSNEELIEKIKGVRYIVINTCHGGFGLSAKAEKEYKEVASIDDKNWNYYTMDRDDPYLVQVVKRLGKEANGAHADLKIVEIPQDVDWEIGEYDGKEWIAEKHRTWS